MRSAVRRAAFDHSKSVPSPHPIPHSRTRHPLPAHLENRKQFAVEDRLGSCPNVQTIRDGSQQGGKRVHARTTCPGAGGASESMVELPEPAETQNTERAPPTHAQNHRSSLHILHS